MSPYTPPGTDTQVPAAGDNDAAARDGDMSPGGGGAGTVGGSDPGGASEPSQDPDLGDSPGSEDPADELPAGDEPGDSPAGDDPSDPAMGEEPVEPTPGDEPVEPTPGEEPVEPTPGDEPVEPEPIDYGEGDGSDVVTIGDSWMSFFLNGGGIEGALARAGKDYRNYAVAGTTLGGSIPGQYESAKRANPDIATVIMTGGGNDIMFSNACNTSAGCEEAVQMIVDMLDELWTQMADDGVQDVVYINYSSGAGTSPEGTRPDEGPNPPSICLTDRIRCHSLPTTDLVMGDLQDGIHPTRTACDRIAAGVIELMEAEGVRR